MSKYDDIEPLSKERRIVDIGKLVDMVRHRLINITLLDAEVVAKRLVSYICMHSIEGGELTPAVMGQIFSTVTDICHGGIVIPEVYSEK